MLYVIGCLTMMGVMGLIWAISWYLWPRLKYARTMQDPEQAALARYEAEERLFELERRKVLLQMDVERHEAELRRIEAETDVTRKVIKLGRHQSAFTVDGEFYYAPSEPKILNAPEDVETDSTVFQIGKLFSQLVQVYGIVGGQQVGKTFQARHIVSGWQRRGVETWVIGPKWDKGEWQGCKMFGGGGNYKAVGRGLDKLHTEAKRRHADTQINHKQHPVLVAVLDDWTPIVENCQNAKLFIYDATTLFASVNIILIFIIHADTADAWGVGRKGAALTHGFIKAYLHPKYRDEDGHIDRHQTWAEVWLPGSAGRVPMKLESGPVSWPAVQTVQSRTEVVSSGSDASSMTVHEKFVELYEGREREVAECVVSGWSKTRTRSEVTGGNAEIAEMYDKIKNAFEGYKSEATSKKSKPIMWASMPGVEEKENGGLH